MVVALAGIVAEASVTFSIRWPRTKMSWFFRGVSLCPSISVPARITVRGAVSILFVCAEEFAALHTTSKKSRPKRFIPAPFRISKLFMRGSALRAQDVALNAGVAVLLGPQA